MPKLRVQAQVKRSYNVDFEMEVDDDTLIQPETLDHVIKQAISHEISYGITEPENACYYDKYEEIITNAPPPKVILGFDWHDNFITCCSKKFKNEQCEQDLDLSEGRIVIIDYKISKHENAIEEAAVLETYTFTLLESDMNAISLALNKVEKQSVPLKMKKNQSLVILDKNGVPIASLTCDRSKYFKLLNPIRIEF